MTVHPPPPPPPPISSLFVSDVLAANDAKCFSKSSLSLSTDTLGVGRFTFDAVCASSASPRLPTNKTGISPACASAHSFFNETSLISNAYSRKSRAIWVLRLFLLLLFTTFPVVVVVVVSRCCDLCANSKTAFNFSSNPSHKQHPGFVYKIRALSSASFDSLPSDVDDGNIDDATITLSLPVLLGLGDF